jgi:hypothetical protein
VIAGILLLVWGIGIVLLAFSLQSKIQDAEEHPYKYARELYDQHPLIFCTTMSISLILWPVVAGFVLYKTFVKGV